MSKVDAMRALREARYAASRTPGKPGTAPAAPRPARSTPAAAPAPAAPEAVPAEARCGHRNMGGRICTREADHAQKGTKNHRYG